jgi:ribose 5-phosphate isomerase B
MDRKDLESLVRSAVERRLAADREPEPTGSAPARSVPRVVTELEVRDAGLGGTVRAAEGAIVTAAAEDLARAWGVTIERGDPAPRRLLRIAVGADHAGFELKEELKRFLAERGGCEVRDFGTHSSVSVDYPDFAQAVAEAVAAGRADLGVVVDGAGIGSAMTANKVPGIRAAMCPDGASARSSRQHTFANVLTLGGRTTPAAAMREIVAAFLDTPTGEERHAARVRKLMAVEAKYRRT